MKREKLPSLKLVLAAALVAAATGTYAARSSATSTSWTIERYYTNETWHAFADIGTKDTGPDDVYAAQRTLKTLTGKRAGVLNGYGVNLQAPYVFFHWTAALDGGTLTLESAVNLRDRVTVYPIEGGTGRYSDARGTVTLTDAGKHGALATVRYSLR